MQPEFQSWVSYLSDAASNPAFADPQALKDIRLEHIGKAYRRGALSEKTAFDLIHHFDLVE